VDEETKKRSHQEPDEVGLYIRKSSHGSGTSMSRRRTAKTLRVLKVNSEGRAGTHPVVSDVRRHWTETNG
jgi:hypothetical protein